MEKEDRKFFVYVSVKNTQEGKIIFEGKERKFAGSVEPGTISVL